MGAKRNTPRSGGGGGAGIALTLAVLVFSLIALSSMVGCSGHNDPVRSDQSGVLYRSAQDFSQPEEWGDACTLDSSTSTWTVTGGTIGDIATDDGDIDLPFTAFVRTKPIMGGTVVGLVLLNGNWESVYEGDFYYQQGYQHCVHPAVEVTYSHPDQSDPQLTVHIIWAEEFPNQWDIVYGQLQFDPTEEPPWEPAYESGLVTDTGACYETQPDLAVYYPDGDLYAVYRAEVAGPTRYAIYTRNLEYGADPDEWSNAEVVAQLNPTLKEYPSIDLGPYSGTTGATLTQQVEVVWCQTVDGYKHIFYNPWEVGESPYYGDAIRISPDIGEADQILPKIDSLPYSAELGQAVIAWGCEDPVEVMMVVTPFIGEEFDYPVYDVDYSRCPELAGCQGTYGGFDGLIALFRHFKHPYMVWWGVEASTYSVDVDYLNQTFHFDEKQWTLVGGVPLWDAFSPVTTLTMSLRIPDPDDWDENNFAIGWIEDDDTAYLAEGNTIP